MLQVLMLVRHAVLLYCALLPTLACDSSLKSPQRVLKP